LGRIRNDNVRREFTLTDVVAQLVDAPGRVSTASGPVEEFASINRPADRVLAALRMHLGTPVPDWQDPRQRAAALEALDDGITPLDGQRLASYLESVKAMVGPVLDLSGVAGRRT
jgi:hypothetical protein